MPNRIIKESIRESYSIDQLSADAEVTFYRLLTYADDFGIFKADPRLINKAIFPLKTFLDKSVAKWLNEIAQTKMIVFYIGENKKPYGIFTEWANHNSPRNKKPKHPQPVADENVLFDDIFLLLQSIENNCNQMKSIAALIQSNPNPNPNPNPIQGKKFIPPSEADVIKYFHENGYPPEVAERAFKYYSTSDPPWTDARGNQVKNWKQKMVGVWFKPENKASPSQSIRPQAEPDKYKNLPKQVINS